MERRMIEKLLDRIRQSEHDMAAMAAMLDVQAEELESLKTPTEVEHVEP